MGIGSLGRIAAGGAIGLAAGSAAGGLANSLDAGGGSPKDAPKALAMLALAVSTPAIAWSQIESSSSLLRTGGGVAMGAGTVLGALLLYHATAD